MITNAATAEEDLSPGMGRSKLLRWFTGLSRRDILEGREALQLQSIAIIGGGPSGSTAAERLLRNGRAFSVTIFEEQPEWEKPCGGGLTAKAIERYPFLMDALSPHFRVEEAEIIAGSGEAVRFRLRAPLLVYSRQVLNRLLLDRAGRAGASVVRDHITSFTRASGCWRLEGRNGVYKADYVILASGARSALRKLVVPPIEAADLLLTFGYFTPPASPLLRVKFFDGFKGYAWAFPRPDHVSAGIAGHMAEYSMADLRRRLDQFILRFGYASEGAPVFAHVLPALGAERWRDLALAGDGWAIVGDAGGLVDPLTGEGIYFAMRSGEMLAEALADARPARYPDAVWSEFGCRHAAGARLVHRFYLTNFWGKPVTTRMVQFCARSPSFMRLLQDMFEGTQGYAGLPRRMHHTLGKGVVEIAAGAVKHLLAGAS